MFNSNPDVVGVDFSGAAKAGRHIWIAECSDSDEMLTVDRCYAAETEVETDERDRVLERLCAAISSAESCVVGLDFPFGIPKTVAGTSEWKTFVEGFEYESPDRFHEECKTAAVDACGKSYVSRETEDELVGGLCSYDWQIRSQTYYGIRGVLRELLDKNVGVRPMQDSDSVDVVEVYPAATFDKIGAERTGYKQKRQESHDARRTNLETLQTADGELRAVEFSDEVLRDYALCDDNALDAVVCALAAARARDNGFKTDCDRYDPLEGYIYV